MSEYVQGLSFIIPAYNEEGAIAQTAARMHEALSKLDMPFEIIVVNDGSRDRTREFAESVPGIEVVSHPINTGYGSAIKTGILCARYSWIGIVDADLTYDIDELPQLVDKMRLGFDMVVASRQNVLLLDKPMKRFFRGALITFLNLVVAKQIKDPNSGFRIFTKDLAMTFFPFLCNTFSFTTSITVFALGEGFFVSYIPTQYSKREGKSKVRHFRDSLRMIQLILQGITFFNPVKFCLLLAMALAVFVTLPTLLLVLLGWSNVAGYFFTTGVVGAILMAVGVLGDIMRISSVERVQKPSPIADNYRARKELPPLAQGMRRRGRD